MIVNSKQSSQNQKMGGAGFYHTKEEKYVYFNIKFLGSLFFHTQTNTQKMLCEKYEITISMTK